MPLQKPYNTSLHLIHSLGRYFPGLKGSPWQPHQSPIDSDNSSKWLSNETGLRGTSDPPPVSGPGVDVQYSWQFRACPCCCVLFSRSVNSMDHPKTAQINCSVLCRATARALYCHKVNNKLLVLNISTDLHSNNPAAVIALGHTLTGVNCCYLSLSYTDGQMVKQNMDSTTAGTAQAQQKTRHKVSTGRERCEQENCKKQYVVVHSHTVLLVAGENKPALLLHCCSPSVQPCAHATPTSGWEHNHSAPRQTLG